MSVQKYICVHLFLVNIRFQETANRKNTEAEHFGGKINE